MHQLSPCSLITLLSCIVIFVRVASFRRRRRRHRPGVALIAWAVCAFSAVLGVKVAMGLRPPVGPIETLCVLVLAIALLIARGNVAQLLTGNR